MFAGLYSCLSVDSENMLCADCSAAQCSWRCSSGRLARAGRTWCAASVTRSRQQTRWCCGCWPGPSWILARCGDGYQDIRWMWGGTYQRLLGPQTSTLWPWHRWMLQAVASHPSSPVAESALSSKYDLSTGGNDSHWWCRRVMSIQEHKVQALFVQPSSGGSNCQPHAASTNSSIEQYWTFKLLAGRGSPGVLHGG